MPARKKTTRRRNARNRRSTGLPGWFWMLGGVLIGLGIAVALTLKGYLPELKQRASGAAQEAAETREPELAGNRESKPPEPKKPRYDFFTVLPEMEVVVPEQELSRQAGPDASGTQGASQDSYVLQAGSFRSASEAEQLKAQLALLGSVARIQAVTVNEQTWHRVRLGPYKGARKADEMRRLLAEHQIETLVMKANP